MGIIFYDILYYINERTYIFHKRAILEYHYNIAAGLHVISDSSKVLL